MKQIRHAAAASVRLARAARTWLLLGSMAGLLSGCYLMHTAVGQWSLMEKRRPIEKVIADRATTPAVKTQLEGVLQIREFAVRQLGLPENGSYRSYADVQRPYVVWNVFAAPEFSVEPKRWCFPIAGCVAYRGYFNEEKARKFAVGLEHDGYDVHVAGVPAYSTLGHFDDPVLNTMMAWDQVQLASIIFHELAHQVAYAPSDSSFNEAFASTVEEEGVRRWLTAQGRQQELDAFRAQRARYLAFADLLADTQTRLRALYASGDAPEQMRVSKAQEFARLEQRYRELKQSWGNPRSGFDAWFAEGINNAHLVSVATYQECAPAFARLLAESNNDLPAFYERVRALTGKKATEERSQFCAGESQPSAARAR